MIIALTEEGFTQFAENVDRSIESGKDFLLPVVRPPRGLGEGSKCYVTAGGKVRGFVEYVGVIALEEHRAKFLGKKMPAGWYVVLRGPFEAIANNESVRTFDGFRYCGEF